MKLLLVMILCIVEALGANAESIDTCTNLDEPGIDCIDASDSDSASGKLRHRFEHVLPKGDVPTEDLQKSLNDAFAEANGVPSFEDCMRRIFGQEKGAGLAPEIQQKAHAFKKVQAELELDIDDFAAIYEWTNDRYPTSAYTLITTNIFKRKKLDQILPMLSRLLMALHKMGDPGSLNVYRKISGSLPSKYEEGQTFQWWAPTSTSKSSDGFSIPSGTRTIFHLELKPGGAGRDISALSRFPGEEEVLLIPGCMFEVRSKEKIGSDLHIHAVEVPNKQTLLLPGRPGPPLLLPGLLPQDR
jgi:hypothetical protein